MTRLLYEPVIISSYKLFCSNHWHFLHILIHWVGKNQPLPVAYVPSSAANPLRIDLRLYWGLSGKEAEKWENQIKGKMENRCMHRGIQSQPCRSGLVFSLKFLLFWGSPVISPLLVEGKTKEAKISWLLVSIIAALQFWSKFNYFDIQSCSVFKKNGS